MHLIAHHVFNIGLCTPPWDIGDRRDWMAFPPPPPPLQEREGIVLRGTTLDPVSLR